MFLIVRKLFVNINPGNINTNIQRNILYINTFIDIWRYTTSNRILEPP